MANKKLSQKSSRKRSAIHQEPSTSDMEAKRPKGTAQDSPQSTPTGSQGASESSEAYVTKTLFEILGNQDDTDKKKKAMEKLGLWPDTIVNTSKIFSDPIHGNITIHPVCVAVINTPEFQRLRDLKQLGMSHFVYPGATHTRFEHSLGVCYLAGTFVRQLKQNQPELKINNKDILCLELAGLCHDLGYGSYCHLFDGKVVPALEKVPKETKEKWNHEYASQELFDVICKKHCSEVQNTAQETRVQAEFKEYGLEENDITFIKALIKGEIDISDNTGRDADKDFLYEIVANKRNGIDVDKWDYIARDCHQLGIRSTFDHSRFMKFARVISVNGKKHICVRDKELINLYDLFTSRYLLHRNAYQHKVICALDIMVAQALSKADNNMLFDGKKMSEIIVGVMSQKEDVGQYWKAYTLLTDNILYKIRDHDSKGLKEAQAIINRIFSRDFFKCVGESPPFKPKKSKERNKEKEDRIKDKILGKCLPTNDTTIEDSDFFVQVVNLDFGKKEKNPLENIHVYNKESPDDVIKQPPEVSTILKPLTFREQMIRVYASNMKQETVIKQAYDDWIEVDFPKERAKPKAAPKQPETASSPE